MTATSGSAASGCSGEQVHSAVETPSETRPRSPGARRYAVGAGSARSLLLTILGELVYPDQDPVWTAPLLYALAGLGVEEKTARQALSRSASAGWIQRYRCGRAVRWSLTDAGRRLIADGIDRVYSLGAERVPWDGRWLFLAITVPHSRRLVRKRLYSRLGWAGFGNPTPGVWLTPHADRQVEAKALLDEFGLSDSALAITGVSNGLGLSNDEIVRRSWDLDTISARYERLIEIFSHLHPEPGDDVLFTHLKLVNHYQRFPFMDPQLPDELLPADWSGREAARLFHRLRSHWYDEAMARWLEVGGSFTHDQPASAL